MKSASASGNISVALNDTSIDFKLIFDTSPGHPFVRLGEQTNGCNVDLKVSKIKLTGLGLLSQFLTLFEKQIESMLGTHLNSLACDDTRIGLSHLSSFMEPFKHDPEPAIPVPVRIPGDTLSEPLLDHQPYQPLTMNLCSLSLSLR